MHDSFTPLGGLVPMWLMQLGEVVFGGVGSGLYGMLVFAIIAVFIAGLMVGRTPEYLGKKIEAYEMKMASLVILVPPLCVLSARRSPWSHPMGRERTPEPRPARLQRDPLRVLRRRATTTAARSPGSAPTTRFYNSPVGLAMLLRALLASFPTLAIAGSLAEEVVPAGPGTLPTHTPLFVGLLVGTVVLVGALTFIPALALGPVVEALR